jgi:putative oxidoreductase
MTEHHTYFSAALLLRLSLGAIWLSHGLLTLVAVGVPAFGAALAAQGMPTPLAWPAALIELVGGGMIVFGVYGRVVTLALLPLLAGVLLAEGGNGWSYAVFLTIASVMHVAIGGLNRRVGGSPAHAVIASR